MGHRVLKNTGEKLIAAVIKIGAKNGISGTSSKKVGDMIGVSEFPVSTYFGSKQGLVDAAAKTIDLRFKKRVDELIDEGHSPEEFWSLLYESLLQSPDSVMYHKRYKDEVGTEIFDKPSESEWLPRAKKLFDGYNLAETDYQWLWNYLLSSALKRAEDTILRGKNNSELRNLSTMLVFDGINSVLESGHQ